MAYYKDLREHLKNMEEKGKLIRIKREINKDTELLPWLDCNSEVSPRKNARASCLTTSWIVKGRSMISPWW